MKRLDLSTQEDWAAFSIAFPDSDITVPAYNLPINNSSMGHFKFKLGDLDMMIVTDGHILINPAHPIFAPEISIDEVNTALKDGFMEEGEIDAAINILVIFKENRIIVLDTGGGNALRPNAGRFQENLIAAGIHPKDVTDILITHLHIDHIGGILDSEGQPVFSNASYLISRVEYDFWMSANPDFSQSKSTDSLAESTTLARQVIAGIHNNLQLFEFGDTLFDCIRTESAEGHTPGHPLLTIYSGIREIKHIVDIVHTSLLISNPDWGTQWDTDFGKGVATRHKILRELAESRQLAMSCHLPWPGLGYVLKNNNSGYQWISKPFSSPQLFEV